MHVGISVRSVIASVYRNTVYTIATPNPLSDVVRTTVSVLASCVKSLGKGPRVPRGPASD